MMMETDCKRCMSCKNSVPEGKTTVICRLPIHWRDIPFLSLPCSDFEPKEEKREIEMKEKKEQVWVVSNGYEACVYRNQTKEEAIETFFIEEESTSIDEMILYCIELTEMEAFTRKWLPVETSE